ncbi:MAG TPA: hypothetical protein IAB31_10165 [Candidatus Choladousia intestinavium]|uniref:Uncharacterized protein n=1 Tax=Candidatus Choladousia intestinavium TaxID=2840727 RepID=A0A9D1ADQ9_9FIRM|nr:hypothetical protein [Candidatus Choladousia intestinavium]
MAASTCASRDVTSSLSRVALA